MKILIIGSEGFIGSHCVDYFSAQGNEVWSADIFESSKPNYVQLSETNTDFESLFQHQSYDVCINASGAANVGFSFDNPAKDFELNVLNVNKILVAIRKFNPKCKLIVFSSAAVYGNPSKLPINESAALSPLSPYGFHKLQSEYLLSEYHKFFGLHTCSLRVFSAYGPRLRKQLFWDLYQKYLLGNEVELFGTGEESRDFIFIDDLVKTVDLVIEHGKFEGDCINVASGIETTIRQAVATFFGLLDSKAKYKFSGKVKIGDPNNWRADTQKLNEMGFTPKNTIEEGLTKLVKWLKEEKLA